MPGCLQGGIDSGLLIPHRTAEMGYVEEFGFKAGAGRRGVTFRARREPTGNVSEHVPETISAL